MSSLNLNNLFAGGKKSYTMEYVPLRIGIKIRPDEEFYNQNA